MRPLAVRALLAKHKEIVDVIRQPLGVEGKVLGGHGGRSKLCRAVYIRVPTIKGVTRSRHMALCQELEHIAHTILYDTGI